eukprot:CAMPEP_0119362200 /NCGR_PEP_ID=MMETSP1334-20130426/9327_1 /TAXON_ID=127549 /ORGANISM="Calcidiscus leptoporus, Strain RCC1130" /LENGTH=36 /DNA_ID= /DNA_START= /DNA_END= /DNA_ORIENTATION=
MADDGATEHDNRYRTVPAHLGNAQAESHSTAAACPS